MTSMKNFVQQTEYVVAVDSAFTQALDGATLVLGEFGIAVLPRAMSHAPAQVPPISAAPCGGTLVARRDIAAWLSVSTRWVERHLRPSAQAASGGRAWYTRDDVEAQLAQLPARETPAARRGLGADELTPSQRRARRQATAGGSSFEGIEHARQVAAVEGTLRARVEKGPRSKRTRKAGER